MILAHLVDLFIHQGHFQSLFISNLKRFTFTPTLALLQQNCKDTQIRCMFCQRIQNPPLNVICTLVSPLFLRRNYRVVRINRHHSKAF